MGAINRAARAGLEELSERDERIEKMNSNEKIKKEKSIDELVCKDNGEYPITLLLVLPGRLSHTRTS